MAAISRRSGRQDSKSAGGETGCAGATVAIFTKLDDADPATDKTRYLHKDHLGSIALITDEAGLVAERRSFDSHGRLRGDDWTAGGTTSGMAESRRGFTGHEHIDSVGLIHMNGRVYDPEIGRFLSADPFVQAPENTQSFNRYSYVDNNPLSATDPSGFFFKSLFKAIGKVFKAIGKALKAVLPTIATIVAVTFVCGGNIACGALLAAGMAGITTLSYGGSLSDALAAAAISGGTALAFSAVGTAFGPVSAFSPAHIAKAAAHGIVGGVTSVVRWGKFVAGFLAGSLTQLAAPGIDRIGGKATDAGYFSAGNRLGRTVAAAVVGGTAAEVGGGKFANGAATGAFSQLFNDELTLLQGTPSGERYPFGEEAEAALNSNIPEELLVREELKWWEWAKGLGIQGEQEAAQWYRGLGYDVYDGLLTLRTAEGDRHPDLAFRLPGEDWAFVEVKVNSSPLIPSQIHKDRAIETTGFVGISGPPEILGLQAGLFNAHYIDVSPKCHIRRENGPDGKIWD